MWRIHRCFIERVTRLITFCRSEPGSGTPTYFTTPSKEALLTRYRSFDHILAIRLHLHHGPPCAALRSSKWHQWQKKRADVKMGIHCFPVLQHQHAQQLGLCVQHFCSCTHYLAQFRQRDDDVGWRCQGKAVFETASVERRPVDGRRACECVG